jgi:hypothetical protein
MEFETRQCLALLDLRRARFSLNSGRQTLRAEAREILHLRG